MKLQDFSANNLTAMLNNYKTKTFGLFSLVMPIYRNDDTDDFKRAFMSVLKNSLLPNEVIFVFDGPVKEDIETWISFIQSKTANWISIIKFKENKGLGSALRAGVKRSKNKLIARADSDDLNVPNRFQMEYEFMQGHAEISIVGGQIQEFSRAIGDGTFRIVPTTDEKIKKWSKLRNPFNHPTVMFRKEAVINAGNYQDYKGLEDYDLWFRVLSQKNVNVANLDMVLVHMNIGNSLYARRGGKGYLGNYTRLKYRMLRNHYISVRIFFISVAGLALTVMTPYKIKKWLYQRVLRK